MTIPFRIPESILSVPTRHQISWRVEPRSITVSWNNVPENVREYSLSLTGPGSPYATPQSVDLQTQESITLSGLTPETLYTLTIRAMADPNIYAKSEPFRSDIMTRNALSAPAMVTAVTANSRQVSRNT
ncbi:MAG: fibronectin type III domain-containing protein [Candidatus Oxydemutatoraceae bacterium WSBS_2016_MAG_OTU14]